MKTPRSKPIRLGGYSDALRDLSDEELSRRRFDAERLLREICEEEVRRGGNLPQILWGSPS